MNTTLGTGHYPNQGRSRIKPLIFKSKIDLAGIQSFRPGRYVLFLRVAATSLRRAEGTL